MKLLCSHEVKYLKSRSCKKWIGNHVVKKSEKVKTAATFDPLVPATKHISGGAIAVWTHE